MGFTRFNTDVKVHESLSDYPNIDDGMTAEELKELFDKPGVDLKTALNGLMTELEAAIAGASIGAAALDESDTSSANVQAKLAKIYTELKSIYQGGVEDSSIATAKLASNAVTSAKIADSSITTSKISDDAVSTAKIIDGAVTTAKVANGAITSTKLDTNAKKAENLTATAITETDESDGNIQAKLNYLASELLEISQGGVADNSISTSKIVNGAVTTAKIATGYGLVPSGFIGMWSGSSSNIPTGWYLCNGENSTPDLRDRFIVGAGNEYSVGSTGGEKTHTLTVGEMPEHSHTYSKATSTDYASGVANGFYKSSETANTSSVGGGQAHENRPPYYALCFIMKA